MCSPSTPGSAVEEQGKVLKLLFNRPQFRINVVPDAPTVELCGALKVSLGGGGRGGHSPP